MDGLRPTIRRDVMLMRPTTYDAATVCAFDVEQALMDINVELQRKRHQAQQSVAIYALLDFRATHSFIPETFVKRQGNIPEAMDFGFRVSIPSGDQMFTSSMARNLELHFQKNVVQADLIVLQMPEFDIILVSESRGCRGGQRISQCLSRGRSGIPPDREVNFSIELMMGPVPIFKASYPLEPAKIKELKDQIQDFPGKGFIRLSFRHGEHPYYL
ncbi:uncharacterized protein LOC142523859 [Primulina tabacum]|uniref:uncharacterized protein LOC142523859 n=1 Tax=Primulina tabacum TaxID=48773 RepID=UPI003F5AABAC